MFFQLASWRLPLWFLHFLLAILWILLTVSSWQPFPSSRFFGASFPVLFLGFSGAFFAFRGLFSGHLWGVFGLFLHFLWCLGDKSWFIVWFVCFSCCIFAVLFRQRGVCRLVLSLVGFILLFWGV